MTSGIGIWKQNMLVFFLYILVYLTNTNYRNEYIYFINDLYGILYCFVVFLEEINLEIFVLTSYIYQDPVIIRISGFHGSIHLRWLIRSGAKEVVADSTQHGDCRILTDGTRCKEIITKNLQVVK